jgi:two-component system sensor histidine kinase/response regulator
MGAEPLRMLAAELEQALHGSADPQVLAGLMEPAQARLEGLVGALRAVPGLMHTTSAAPADLSDAARADLLPVLQQLRRMLEQDDSEAQALWEQHAAGLRALLGPSEALEQAISAFDFEAALRLLQQEA